MGDDNKKKHIAALEASYYHKNDIGCVTRCNKTNNKNKRRSGFEPGNKHCHRWQGWKFIKDDPKRSKSYNAPYAYDPKTWITIRGTPYKTNIWNIGLYKNYKNQDKPYFNNAHHLIGIGVLYDKLYDDKLETKLLLLLMHGGYFIHDGRNIIFLPTIEFAAQLLNLPTHCPSGGCHSQYCNFVKPKLTKIRAKLKKKLKNKKVHEVRKDTAEKLAEEVHEISNALFDMLVIYGSDNVVKDIDNTAALKRAWKKYAKG